MMQRARRIFVVLLMVALSGFAFGQSNGDSDGRSAPATIDELYLMQDIQIQTIRSQALSQDRAVKLLAIENIRSLLETGGISSDNDGVRLIIESLASEGTFRQQRQGGRIVNDYPLVRREAANLLGRFGGEDAMETLVRMLPVESEAIVSAEVIYSLGQIGMNPNNRVSRTIVNTLNRNTLSATPDNFLTWFAIDALEQLAGDAMEDPEVVAALLDVTTGNYTLTVRDKARETINSFLGLSNEGDEQEGGGQGGQ